MKLVEISKLIKQLDAKVLEVREHEYNAPEWYDTNNLDSYKKQPDYKKWKRKLTKLKNELEELENTDIITTICNHWGDRR